MHKASLYIKDLSLDSEHIQYLSLSILLKQDGFSFLIKNKQLKKVVALVDYNKISDSNPLALIEAMNEIFKDEKLLQFDFSEIEVIHQNNLSTLVPKQLFNEENAFDYLNFNHCLFENEFVTYDVIEDKQIVVVYSPFVEVNDFLLDKFGEFEYKHLSTVLIEKYLKEAKAHKEERVFLNVSKKQCDICVIKNKEVEFFNSFKIISADDLVYFTMFVFEQLQIDASEVKLELSGQLDLNSERYMLLHRYVKNIEFLNAKTEFKLSHEFDNTDNLNSYFAILK